MTITLKNILYIGALIGTTGLIYLRNQDPAAASLVMTKTLDSCNSYLSGQHIYLQVRDLTYGEQLVLLQQAISRHDAAAIAQVKAALIFNLTYDYALPATFVLHYVKGICATYQGAFLYQRQLPTYTTYYVHAIRHLQEALKTLPLAASSEDYNEFKMVLAPLRHAILHTILYQKQFLSASELKAIS